MKQVLRMRGWEVGGDELWPRGTTSPTGVDNKREGNRMLRFHQECLLDSQARTWVGSHR